MGSLSLLDIPYSGARAGYSGSRITRARSPSPCAV